MWGDARSGLVMRWMDNHGYLFKKKRGSDIVRRGLDLLVRRGVDQMSSWREEDLISL